MDNVFQTLVLLIKRFIQAFEHLRGELSSITVFVPKGSLVRIRMRASDFLTTIYLVKCFNIIYRWFKWPPYRFIFPFRKCNWHKQKRSCLKKKILRPQPKAYTETYPSRISALVFQMTDGIMRQRKFHCMGTKFCILCTQRKILLFVCGELFNFDKNKILILLIL